ncbi:hypothetical protein [Kribbella sp. NPDC048915]|uniref:hypothetical protein n=1 Tax=Kribbella sp. NPDC048915 TaxID=3155148 RepID=UPI0033EF7BC7
MTAAVTIVAVTIAVGTGATLVMATRAAVTDVTTVAVMIAGASGVMVGAGTIAVVTGVMVGAAMTVVVTGVMVAVGTTAVVTGVTIAAATTAVVTGAMSAAATIAVGSGVMSVAGRVVRTGAAGTMRVGPDGTTVRIRVGVDPLGPAGRRVVSAVRSGGTSAVTRADGRGPGTRVGAAVVATSGVDPVGVMIGAAGSVARSARRRSGHGATTRRFRKGSPVPSSIGR